MTKQTNVAVEQPAMIELCDLTSVVFAQASALIRQGYIFSKVVPPQMFMSGQSAITLELSDPDADALVGAATAATTALARQKAQEQRQDLEAQRRTREHEERLAKQTQIAADIAAAKAHLKKLEQAHRSA